MTDRDLSAVLLGLALAVILVLPAGAGEVEQERIFGPGVGYPDFGSARYFYTYYPPERWGVYGYGTGHMGMGYGPYIYGGRRDRETVDEMPDFGIPVLRPEVRWIGGNEIRVRAPAGPGTVTRLRVDILSFNGSVIDSASSVVSPYETIARLPEGAAHIRVHMDLADGFSARVFPIVPVK